jgi:hypothetical protein
MSPNIFGRYIVFAFAVGLSVRPVVCPSELSLSGLHRSIYWWDFNQTLQECAATFLVFHIISMFCFVAQNGRQS